MQGNRDATGQTADKRGTLARIGAKALHLILDGIAARSHAIAGTRPAPLPLSADE